MKRKIPVLILILALLLAGVACNKSDDRRGSKDFAENSEKSTAAATETPEKTTLLTTIVTTAEPTTTVNATTEAPTTVTTTTTTTAATTTTATEKPQTDVGVTTGGLEFPTGKRIPKWLTDPNLNNAWHEVDPEPYLNEMEAVCAVLEEAYISKPGSGPFNDPEKFWYDADDGGCVISTQDFGSDTVYNITKFLTTYDAQRFDILDSGIGNNGVTYYQYDSNDVLTVIDASLYGITPTLNSVKQQIVVENGYDTTMLATTDLPRRFRTVDMDDPSKFLFKVYANDSGDIKVEGTVYCYEEYTSDATGEKVSETYLGNVFACFMPSESDAYPLQLFEMLIPIRGY